MSPQETSATMVIVRAYADEPVRLAAGRRNGAYVDVYNTVTGHAIAFPAAQVFHDDPGLFDELRLSFISGYRERLISMWQTARRYDV
jgi:hypothetical protein